MAKYMVDSAQVQAASVRTATAVGQIRGEVAAMMGILTELQGTWTGAASLAFGACADQWRATQAQVEASLDQISQALSTAATTYENAEAGAQGLFR